MYIYPYKKGSASVLLLKQGLGAKVIKREGSKFSGTNKVVINWGSSDMNLELLKAKVINHPEAVAIASDKLKFFNKASQAINIPEYTQDKGLVKEWLYKDCTVFARETLVGSGGVGIIILNGVTGLERLKKLNSPLYVKYIPKVDEYRVHVIGGVVVDFQKKALKKEFIGNEKVDWKIRNLNNGFVFIREGVSPPKEVLDQAIKAVEICGLDFGAVDVIWNNHRGKAYVLEVNTAPGLEGQTVETYIDGLTNLYNKKKNKGKPANNMVEMIFNIPLNPALDAGNFVENEWGAIEQEEEFDF